MSQTFQILDAWKDPITKELMNDPVIGSDGQTYQRSAILEWFKYSNTSPITRQIMSSQNLVQNYALRDTIEEMTRGQIIEPIIEETTVEHQNTECSFTFESAKFKDEKYVLINVNPPIYGKRMPIGLVAVVDVSGSMSEEASVSNGNIEFNGNSRLDLTKHSLNTIVKSLKDNDIFGIVIFSDNAHVLLKPIKMNNFGRKLAYEKIRDMHTLCSTNLWEGISYGLELTKDPLFRNIQTNICVFTDGISNSNPPRGVLSTLKGYISANKSANIKIHVFGYGYDLDVELLSTIASITNSIYSYIPDCTMVGTVFINFLSYILATSSYNNQLEIIPSNGTIIEKVYGYNSTNINLGNIQFGQSKNILLRIQGESNKLTVNFKSSSQNVQQLFEIFNETDEDLENILLNYGRLTFVETLSTCMTQNLYEALKNIRQLHTNLSQLPVAEKLKPFLTDLISSSKDQGQIEKAFLNQEWYEKWGKLYIPSITNANLIQFCNNFKDLSVQQYGGKLFTELQDSIDDIFNKLEPPAPSLKKPVVQQQQTQQQQSQQQAQQNNNYAGINNPRIGCFHGDGFIRLGNGSETYVKDVQIGTSLKTPNGIAKVICVLKMKVPDSIADLVKINDMYITPWHPVIGPDNNWIFPTDHPDGNRDSYECDYVYNFVLDSNHIVIINNIQCCTLAHNFKGDIIEHDFFGTYKVIDDLIKMPGWKHGYIYMEKYHFTNDIHTGLINGWVLD